MATQQEIEDELRRKGGISENIIKEESKYLAEKYGRVPDSAVEDYRKRSIPHEGHGQSEQPAQAWNQESGGDGGGGGSSSPFPDWYRGLMERSLAMQEAERARNQQRADALYGTLMERSQQGLQVSPDDPVIKAQTTAYGAGQERSRRNYLSDLAERTGPYANLRGEQRMTAEKVGQNTSGFQAELLQRELGARRNEISEALASMGGMVSGDQMRALQRELATYDQAIKEAGANNTRYGIDTQRDLGFADLALRDKLGMGGLDLQRRGLDQNLDMFLRELAQRQYEFDDTSDWRWAGL